MKDIVYEIAKKAKEVSYFLSEKNTGLKNKVLKSISDALLKRSGK